MFQKALGRLEHALVFLENILPDDPNVMLGFGLRVRTFRHKGKAYEKSNYFIHYRDMVGSDFRFNLSLKAKGN